MSFLPHCNKENRKLENFRRYINSYKFIVSFDNNKFSNLLKTSQIINIRSRSMIHSRFPSNKVYDSVVHNLYPKQATVDRYVHNDHTKPFNRRKQHSIQLFYRNIVGESTSIVYYSLSKSIYCQSSEFNWIRLNTVIGK